MTDLQGLDATSREVVEFLRHLNAGDPPRGIEKVHVDAKEEAGRRDRQGTVLPGSPQSEEAAKALLEAFACMANTPGGGALVIGVGDDGSRPGAMLDAEWLRHRVWELSDSKLTIDVREVYLDDGTRTLVGRVHQAIEPIRVNGRIVWRVADNCVEVDATTWHRDMTLRHHDWSSEATDIAAEDSDPLALAVARRFLRAAGSPEAAELADANDAELLRRLPNVVAATGTLTRAGSLLFANTAPVLDYHHRRVAGDDATIHIHDAGPLLVQLDRVFDALDARATNFTLHAAGPSASIFPALPSRSAREAIINGVVHRDWSSPEATVVEHVGDRLRVTSPGGLVGTVTPDNIISHVSTPRHRALAELTTRLRLTERQGIGVDRMYQDLLWMGRPAPEIAEIPGPRVSVTLLGGRPDDAWVTLLGEIDRAGRHLAGDLNILFALDLVLRQGWLDAPTLAPIIQWPVAVATGAIDRLRELEVGGRPLLTLVDGQPDRAHPAWTSTSMLRDRLAHRTAGVFTPTRRASLLLGYAQHMGRVSTTEASSLVAVSTQIVGEVLKDLEADEELVPSRQNRAGAGFHYRPANGKGDAT